VTESLNDSLRKMLKNRAAFPSGEAVFRLIYPGLLPVSRKWAMPIVNWNMALQQLALLFEDRLP
jgi:putative transposase